MNKSKKVEQPLKKQKLDESKNDSKSENSDDDDDDLEDLDDVLDWRARDI